jgi:hypothetical protein
VVLQHAPVLQSAAARCPPYLWAAPRCGRSSGSPPETARGGGASACGASPLPACTGRAGPGEPHIACRPQLRGAPSTHAAACRLLWQRRVATSRGTASTKQEASPKALSSYTAIILMAAEHLVASWHAPSGPHACRYLTAATALRRQRPPAAASGRRQRTHLDEMLGLAEGAAEVEHLDGHIGGVVQPGKVHLAAAASRKQACISGIPIRCMKPFAGFR